MNVFRVAALLKRIATIVVLPATIETGEAAATTVTLLPVADTYVDQDQTGINFAGAADLQVARTVEFLTMRRGYLRFDITGIPATSLPCMSPMETA